MNTPGLAAGNWEWRYRQEMLTPKLTEYLHQMTQLYGRLPS